MENIIRKLKNDEVDVQYIRVETEVEEEIFLPQQVDDLNMARAYQQIMFFYRAGIDQLTVKLQILSNEFQVGNDRNPIKDISSRVKSPESITEKMKRKNIPYTMSCMMNYVHDIAGIRVICPLISDVYYVAKMLSAQADIEVIKMKDYIRNPKKNGYRSLHMIVMVDVYFSDQKRRVPVEIQLRTIAMDFWASLEHQLRYKKNRTFTEEMEEELKVCAELMSDADIRMQNLASSMELDNTEDIRDDWYVGQ